MNEARQAKGLHACEGRGLLVEEETCPRGKYCQKMMTSPGRVEAVEAVVASRWQRAERGCLSVGKACSACLRVAAPTAMACMPKKKL